MVWHVRYAEEHDAVLIKTLGDITYQELPSQFEEAVQLANEKGTTRFVFDDTELHINVSKVDIYKIPRLIFSAGINLSSRIAVVVSPEETRLDNYRFLETVCLNQGLRVKVFTDFDEACRWFGE